MTALARMGLGSVRLMSEKAGQHGKCANGGLSQRRGSPHSRVPKLCPGPTFLAVFALVA